MHDQLNQLLGVMKHAGLWQVDVLTLESRLYACRKNCMAAQEACPHYNLEEFACRLVAKEWVCCGCTMH